MSLQSREKSLNACTRCTNCRWLPSIASEEFASICPSYRYGKFNSYSGGGKVITAFALLHNTMEYDEKMLDSVYACSAWGGCDVSCAAVSDDMVEPMEAIYALRQRIVEDGKLPDSLQKVLDNLKQSGVSGAADDRGKWCSGLTQSQKNASDTLLLVGNAALNEARWPELRAMVSMLEQTNEDLMIAGKNEVNSGGLAFEIGDKALAIELATKFVAYVKSSGAKRIVTQSDEIFAALENYYPRMGIELGDIEVLHISQWMLKHAAPSAQTTDTVTYHDSCRLGRLGERYVPWDGEHEIVFGSISVRKDDTVSTRYGNNGVYDEPRQVVEASGATLVEMPRKRETSYCCGLGAGAKDFNPDFAAAAARDRLTEALSTGTKTMITSCSECACHLQEVADHEGMDIKVTSLLEFTQKPEV